MVFLGVGCLHLISKQALSCAMGECWVEVLTRLDAVDKDLVGEFPLRACRPLPGAPECFLATSLDQGPA